MYRFLFHPKKKSFLETNWNNNNKIYTIYAYYKWIKNFMYCIFVCNLFYFLGKNRVRIHQNRYSNVYTESYLRNLFIYLFGVFFLSFFFWVCNQTTYSITSHVARCNLLEYLNHLLFLRYCFLHLHIYRHAPIKDSIKLL